MLGKYATIAARRRKKIPSLAIPGDVKWSARGLDIAILPPSGGVYLVGWYHHGSWLDVRRSKGSKEVGDDGCFGCSAATSRIKARQDCRGRTQFSGFGWESNLGEIVFVGAKQRFLWLVVDAIVAPSPLMCTSES